jgi:hypothetical protein
MAMMRLEGLGKFKKNNYVIGTRIRDLLTCSMALKPSTLPRAPFSTFFFSIYNFNLEYDHMKCKGDCELCRIWEFHIVGYEAKVLVYILLWTTDILKETAGFQT